MLLFCEEYWIFGTIILTTCIKVKIPNFFIKTKNIPKIKYETNIQTKKLTKSIKIKNFYNIFCQKFIQTHLQPVKINKKAVKFYKNSQQNPIIKKKKTKI